MSSWTGVVAALSTGEQERMNSRLPIHLHPVAGRPLVWHAVSSLTALSPGPARVLVLGGAGLPEDLFHDIGGDAPVVTIADEDLAEEIEGIPAGPVLLLDAAAIASQSTLRLLLEGPTGTRLSAADGDLVGAYLPSAEIQAALAGAWPERTSDRQAGLAEAMVVRDRASLATAGTLLRDRIVEQLMAAGVTFILPDSVVVDVDVRIGRDTVVYPGAVLEGQTTVGEETVIGPGCRIISSWIGSGVEMKGWNYIAHTSVRNRAILEPYVRRGFD